MQTEITQVKLVVMIDYRNCPLVLQRYMYTNMPVHVISMYSIWRNVSHGISSNTENKHKRYKTTTKNYVISTSLHTK